MAQSITNLFTPKTDLSKLTVGPKKPINMSLGQGISFSPTGNVVKKQTGVVSTPTAPKAATQSSGSLGSYNGVPILAGQDIAAQMARIDKPQSTPLIPATSALKAAPEAPKRGLFPDVLSSLANPQTSKETERAMKAYERAVERFGNFEEQSAESRSGIYNEGTSSRVMGARDMALQAIQAEERSRLQGVVQEAQAGIGFGQAQQQLNQAAQTSAAGLAQPSPAGYGQTVFDPTTGAFTGGGSNLDPQVAASQLAEKVRNNQMTYEQAVQSLSYAGGAGQQFLNNALGPGFNAPLSSATIGGQTSVIGNLPALESADTAAEGIKNKITTYLADNPNLNPSTIAKANVLQQWIEGKQLSDAKYQTLFNYLNEYTNTLAPILGVGGNPTNLKTEIAQSFINAAASGQSISEVLENMQGLSRGKLQDLRSGATGGGVVSTPTTGGGTGNGGLFDW